jgi:hypothetical protein
VIIVNQIQSRIFEATGVSLSTLNCILREYEHSRWLGKEFDTCHKMKGQEWKLKLVDESHKCEIWRINEFHTAE